MSLLDGIPHRDRRPGHRPWPRAIAREDGWRTAIGDLVAGRATLLGLWGEPEAVHMALLGAENEIAIITFECNDGTFPSVAVAHPPALRLERTIHDLFLFEVKSPGESKAPYDYYKLIDTIPGDQAFRPLAEGRCPFALN